MQRKERVESKRAKTALESSALILIVAGIFVALNVLSYMGAYKRVDNTSNQRFTLTKGSGALLRSMKQDLKVEAYVTRGLPKLDAFVRDLRDLLLEYKRASGGKFDFELIEARDEETKKKAKEAGLVESPFGEASDTDEKMAVSQGFMGLVFRYGEQTDKIPFLPPERNEGLEFWISNKIREVRDTGDGIKHKIGVLTGHDEMKLSETNLVPSQMGKYAMEGIIKQNFKFYEFVDVDLKNGEADVDDKLDGLIMLQPEKDISEAELKKIDAFVMKGRSLAIFASAVNVKAHDPSMTAKLSWHGIDKLLAGYGIEARKDVILDQAKSFHVTVQTHAGMGRMFFPAFLAIEDDSRFSKESDKLLDQSFPPFFRMPNIVMPFSSSLVISEDKQKPEATIKVHARSTPKAFRRTEESVDLKPFQKWVMPKTATQEQVNLAASIEGNIKSAFKEERSAAKARIFVIASSQYLTNPLARAGNARDMGQMAMMMPGIGGDEQLLQLAGPYAQQAITNAILSFKNSLDWLSGEQELLAASAKIIGDPRLSYGDMDSLKFDPNESEDQLKKRADEIKQQRKAIQGKVQWTLILGIPILIVLLGIARWQLRLRQRESLLGAY